jgi:hypothetical protein
VVSSRIPGLHSIENDPRHPRIRFVVDDMASKTYKSAEPYPGSASNGKSRRCFQEKRALEVGLSKNAEKAPERNREAWNTPQIQTSDPPAREATYFSMRTRILLTPEPDDR